MTDHNRKGMIQRYTTSQRINHWIIAMSFVLLALSGLALFHPSMFWLTTLAAHDGCESCRPTECRGRPRGCVARPDR